MTTNLIALAKQAGAICTPVHFSRCIAEFDNQSLQAFADLIRKDEREKCAVVCEGIEAKTLAAQSGKSDFAESVNLNIRIAALLLPEAAAAIRARTTT